MDRIICTSPETLKSVLSDHSYDYEKPAGVRKFLNKVLGTGLILSEGSLHKFQRKHVLPSFQVQHIRGLYPTFWMKSKGLVDSITAEIAEKKLEAKAFVRIISSFQYIFPLTLLQEKTSEEGLSPVIEFGDWATRVTLDIIGLAGMGRDFGALRNLDDPLVRDYNTLLEPTTDRAIFFAVNILGPQDLILKLPIKLSRDLIRTTTNLKGFCLEHVAEMRRRGKEIKDSAEATDILSLLLKSNDFSDEDLVDQLLTFLAAG